ncbi:MAG: ethanolamine ammonia-lyase subunit EutC [Pseudomonadota bacterium]
MSDISDKLLTQIRAVTQARLEHGNRRQALTTAKTQSFALDHAKAQAAVHAALDHQSAQSILQAHGLATLDVQSAAASRVEYIKRPDLGRMLDDRARLALRSEAGRYDVALVLGDGLSAIAANLNGPAFMAALADALTRSGWTPSPIILATLSRVALGDQIATALDAKLVVMALGERPGLSAADSLGVYITWDPKPETQDSARNCISNIREAGLSIDEAVLQSTVLIAAMRAQGVSGVALSVEDAPRLPSA